MDHYHVWFDLRPGVKDMDFARAFAAFMAQLKARGVIAEGRLTRRKLGLGHPALGEFHAVMTVRDLAQLDAAFAVVAGRGEPVERTHHAVNSQVQNPVFALYRDFPDAVPQEGEERV